MAAVVILSMQILTKIDHRCEWEICTGFLVRLFNFYLVLNIALVNPKHVYNICTMLEGPSEISKPVSGDQCHSILLTNVEDVGPTLY